MEEKKKKKKIATQRNDPNSSTSNQKIFGANTLQVTGDDCSRLIGSIIEKGISEHPQSKPLEPPEVTVLPFPVARHRSHGPHWGPISSKNVVNGGSEGDEDEDIDSTEFGTMSAFANPVQRKQKKGLDLSQWRKLIPSDHALETDKIKGNSPQFKKPGSQKTDAKVVDSLDKKHMPCDPFIVEKTPMEVDGEQGLSSFMPPLCKIGNSMLSDMDVQSLTSAADVEIYNSHQQLHAQENIRDASSILFKTEVGSDNGVPKAQLKTMENAYPALRETLSKRDQKASTNVLSSSLDNFGSEQGSMSLENEIDAENRAQLESMTSEEIVQAQAELMEKMDPALIILLKKRGQEKLKQKKFLRSDEVVSGELGISLAESQSVTKSNVSLDTGHDGSDMITVNMSTDKKSGPDSSMVRDLSPGNGSLWNSWSERVEAVRKLRFSLEGSVIADESKTGDIAIGNKNSSVNVTERDFLRTEGDPAAVGYTIKEAVQLTRSVIPGQRAVALHLLASVLDKAIHNIQQNQVGCTMKNVNLVDKLVDWEAIWAYALGPEPELVLSLRMCLDDNHSSVVLACARVIQCSLNCDLNESFFDISEKIAVYEDDIFTSPVFRSKPEIDGGFLRGGFWKYNAKPTNILTFTEDVIEDETDGKHTIQDDIVLASQDFAAGLVRMGILPRMRYLLEADPNVTLEESIISILVALARHSPTCANAIMRCEGLVHTVVQKFSMGDTTEINSSKIKSVTLLKVLAQSDMKNCVEFIKHGSFQAMIHHLFRYTSSLDHWIKFGKEKCKLLSALMVEQLRFWRGCISYGFCISYFSDVFPALCLWLNPPTFMKLEENNVLSEFVSISREAYLVLEALARKLPSLYSLKEQCSVTLDCASEEWETWSWSFVTPMVDLALKWITSMKDPYVSKYIEIKKGMSGFISKDSSDSSLLWIFSAVMHMLATLLEKVNPVETLTSDGHSRHVPWLPEFVPKVGLEIIKNQFFSTICAEEQEDCNEDGTLVEQLCYLIKQSKCESSLAAVCCLHGLFRVITSIDNLINLAKVGICAPPSLEHNSTREGKILEHGILKSSLVGWRRVLDGFMKLVGSGWPLVQSIEIFGRGGPAPGVGLGWGASGGGFWSLSVLHAQTDARLLIQMFEVFQIVSSTELPTDEELVSAMQRVNSVLGACLTVGPRDSAVMEKALDILLQVPVLKHLGFCIQRFFKLNKRVKQFSWEYQKEDYLLFSEILASHFKNRWLAVKKKLKAKDENNSFVNKTIKTVSISLETIHENLDTSNTSQDHCCTSLTTEWAHQRLPLPLHWLLSPISTISDNKQNGIQSASNIPNLVPDSSVIVEVGKGGLFFLLGVEAMSTFLSSDVQSPIYRVPLVWKFHSLSVILLVGMDVLEDNKSRDVYEALQDIYGQILDEARFNGNPKCILDGKVNSFPDKSIVECLRFQSEIHDSYSTFLETLVEQFAAVSYGDLIFGRQVSVYLHRCTDAVVRLYAWNALSNARVLELLPPLEKCIAETDGYLEPIEDNEDILEAYVKSWVSGALDRSATRGSMAFHLVLHHLSSFIFFVHGHDKISLRNKLLKSLLRDCSQKQKHKALMLELVQYRKPSTSHLPEEEGLSLQSRDVHERFEVLAEACERNSILLAEVENLRSILAKKPNAVK